ncbi:unnamed protein product [Euphydryas editha]|uniref:Reverse transcriptase domain-containing protein n=1 Tax=Euphydryas editha TaxID=104508 RepID=A0AAU9TFX5_EUPED|nr:unnamed protein product [Euphydryas editha]
MMTDCITIYYQNCRGLKTKINTLYSNILADNYDMLILSETWLSATIHDCELIDSRYVLYRCDRDKVLTGKHDGGGVLIAVRRGLSVTRLLLENSEGYSLTPIIDYVLLSLNNKRGKVIVCGVYIPPSQNVCDYDNFLTSLYNKVNEVNYEHVYVVGDFNLPNLLWDGDTASYFSSLNLTNSDKSLLNFMSLLNVKQFNSIRNPLGRILDLFLSSDDNCVCELPSSPLVPLDCLHPAFYTMISINQTYKQMTNSSTPRFSRESKSGIPNVMFYNDKVSDDPEGICELFSDFFRSSFENQQQLSDVDFSDSSINPKSEIISNISLSEDSIIKELKSLNITKGPGPDGIPPFFFKYTATAISNPICLIFNRCLEEGVVPQIWKNANITPVYKTGSKNDIANYRPISLLSTLPKVLERLVHTQIYPILHNIIIPEQHGFVKHRSTVTNLLIYTNYLFLCMDNGLQVDAIYTDYCKAFDRVDHNMLLKKLAFNGIRGNLLRWFSSCVLNRTQRVVINGFSSGVINVSSGVPQGSIRGPLLFVLFVNDIGDCFRYAKFILYADDLKIYHSIKTIDDCSKIQEDLNRLTDYCRKHKLHLSISKCKQITFTKKVNKIEYNYKLESGYLNSVSLIKDLGLYLDSKLHLDYHINQITNHAFQLYGFVMRVCSSFKNYETYLTLYKALVRSQVEYASVIWNPIYDKYSQQLEQIQLNSVFLPYILEGPCWI